MAISLDDARRHQLTSCLRGFFLGELGGTLSEF
jgi:hypothetical protein